MTKFQLWSRDEYGAGSILFTSEKIDEVIKRCKEEVTNINVNNALTTDDRERNWEAYMVVVESGFKRDTKKYIYDCGDPRIRNKVHAITADGDVATMTIQDINKPVIRIYLGNISTSRKEEIDWHATDARRKIIESIDHSDLNDKTQFFIKKV